MKTIKKLESNIDYKSHIQEPSMEKHRPTTQLKLIGHGIGLVVRSKYVKKYRFWDTFLPLKRYIFQ